jgi:hypothetical protein
MLTNQQREIIAAVLSNDETSTDEWLADYFINDIGIDVETVGKIIEFRPTWALMVIPPVLWPF